VNLQENSISKPSDILGRILCMLSFLLIAFVLFENTLLVYGRDQSIYAVVARTMLDGGAPYKDAWDFKPPGIYFIYALARSVFGPGMQAVRILESLGLLSLVFAFGLFSKRHFGSARAGILGGALTLLVHTQFDWWQTAQPESFGAVFLAWAVVCATWAPSPDASRPRLKQAASWFAAGALYTCAALLKPPLGGGFVVSLGLVIYFHWRRSEAAERIGGAVSAAVSFCAGALLVLLGVLAYFSAAGALADMRSALFIFAPHYTAVTASDASFALQLIRVFRYWLLSHSWAGSAGLLLVLLLPRTAAREREGLLHAAGILATQVIGVALQSKFFAYHFGAIFPFTALLAGWGYWKLLRFRGVKWAVPLLLIVLCAIQLISKGAAARTSMRLQALVNPPARETLHDALYSIRTYDASEIREASRYIASNTPGNTPLYIWGFLPVIYDMAGRAPASRYIYNIPQRMEWDGGESRRILMRELAESPPSAIVVAVRDNFRAVTGNDLDSGRELRRFTQLQQFIDARYTLSKQCGDLYIFLRNDLRE
jgi:hypothetical protein